MKVQPKSIFVLLSFFIAVACNPARKLGADQYLLNKNTIVVDNSSVHKDDLKGLIKQKPNRKILGLFRFHLWFYNLFDKEKIARDKAEWVRKTEQKNEIRKAKGKKEKSTDKQIGREKLLDIGEEPAIVDSALTVRTKKQFQLYLFRKGFFNAIVTDTIIYKKNQQANIVFTIHCGQPYTIRNVSFSSKDSVILDIVNADTANTLLRTGNNYDEDQIEMERERISLDIRNRGYYFFNKNYITFFDADSTLNSHQVDLPLYVNRKNENVDPSINPEAVTENHHPYILKNIFIQTDYDAKEPDAIPKDSSSFNDYYFLSKTGQSAFRKEAILRVIFLKKGELFEQQNLDNTYSRLLDLNIFKFIKIIFSEVPRDSGSTAYQLNVLIQLSLLPKHDYTIETEATHTGGNLGGAVNFGYRNKSMFKGAEAFEFKMKFAAEALRNFNDSTAIKKLFFFNSFEIGPEINFTIKRFLFIPENRVLRRINPRTNISAGFNYQERPDYTRRITNFSFAYVWRQSQKWSFALYLADVNSVKVDLSQEFSNKLNKLSDLNLKNSYSTHLTPAGRASAVFTNQSIRPVKSFFFLRGNLEVAGLWLAPLINLALKEPRNADGRKTITGIPYANYVKPDFDFSFHHRLNEHNTLVYRVAAGIGIEGANSSSLPFEKSFFGGGANSLRAWQARTLGPGSYKNVINIEQSGDIKVESNIELRSSLIKILEGAAFVDAGNIWTNHEDIARPGSQFSSKNFVNELAIGAGLGLRFDFSFFILRVDGAVKLHDPSLELNDRWVYTNKNFQANDITLNLAIGYPF